MENLNKGVIEIEKYKNDKFSLEGYQLNALLSDTICVEYADIADGNSQEVNRNGIIVPLSVVNQSWRVGKVLLAGDGCVKIKEGDFVCFPNDKGISISNIDINGHGIKRNCIFLSESRIFGICTPKVNG